VDQGLDKAIFSNADRDTPAGRERGIGVIFKRYLSVALEAETAMHCLRLRLEKLTKRWDRSQNRKALSPPGDCHLRQVSDLSLDDGVDLGR
jgi:hypothetical protein